jgi:predicted Zn-dependent peptidase
MKTEIFRTTLPTGLRVLCEPLSHVESVAVGVWCQTGSRLEAPEEAGISHMAEHMLFKGTKTRTAKDIAEAIEGRGGHINAFTDKEVTCYFARVMADDLSLALEILADMYLHARLDPEDLEKEKGVITEEIRRYEDTPEDQIHDLHARHRWREHPLGRPVIGFRETVTSITRERLVNYLRQRYVAGKTVISAAGNLDPEKFVEDCKKYFEELEGDFDLPLEPPSRSHSGEERISRDVEQVHFCIGCDWTDAYDARRYAASLLDGVLGGGMSSRLFQEIREKRGLAYSIGSYEARYREAGAFTVYGGTSVETFDQVRDLVFEELERVRKEPVGSEELERNKRQAIAGMVMAMESMTTRMSRLARNEILYGRDVPIEEVVEKIQAVTPEDLQEVAQSFLMREGIAVTAIGPF